MTRYYCSGFDINNAFGHGLGDMFKTEFINFAIFNVADIFITCGGICLCVYLLFFYNLHRNRPVQPARSGLNNNTET